MGLGAVGAVPADELVDGEGVLPCEGGEGASPSGVLLEERIVVDVGGKLRRGREERVRFDHVNPPCEWSDAHGARGVRGCKGEIGFDRTIAEEVWSNGKKWGCGEGAGGRETRSGVNAAIHAHRAGTETAPESYLRPFQGLGDGWD